MSNNWKTPKSERMLQYEALTEKHLEEINALRPDLSDDAKANILLATPEIAALGKETEEEFRRQIIEEVIDEDCFVFHIANGKKQVIEDECLRRMSDQELAEWAQKTGVMFAQVKAHLAERFPETKLRIVS